MLTIQDQIKALQRQQAHLDLLKKAIELLSSLPDVSEHENLVSEVKAEITGFCSARFSEIELGKPAPKAQAAASSPFTDEEVQLLKALAAKVAQKAPQSPAQPENTIPEAVLLNRGPGVPGVSGTVAEKQAKAKFAIEHRHLEKARGVFHSKDGPVRCTVVGFDAPNILVETDTGYRVPAPLDRFVKE